MKKRVGQFFLSLILILSLSACNLQLVESSDDEGIFLTMTANALILEQAALAGQTEPPAQEQVVVVVTATGEAGAAVPPSNEQVQPAQVLPPATGDVTVTVTTATNCRKGPGQNFSIVYGMPVGQVAKVVAKNSYSGYWIIEIPGQAGQTCWLWGQYAVINGDTSTLKEVVTPTSPAPTSTNTPKPTNTVQPTATNTTVAAPNAPAITNGSLSCTNNADGTVTYNLSLTWQDNSTDEEAFVVNTNSGARPLPPNTTTYSESITGAPGLTIEASVSAGKKGGIYSAPSSVKLNCP